MSTAYYRIASPITSVKVDEESNRHARLSVWVSGGLAGTLVVPAGDLPELLRLFSKYEDDIRCPLHTCYGGKERGMEVVENYPTLPDGVQVISEYGELTTVGEVKAHAGEGRDATEGGCQ